MSGAAPGLPADSPVRSPMGMGGMAGLGPDWEKGASLGTRKWATSSDRQPKARLSNPEPIKREVLSGVRRRQGKGADRFGKGLLVGHSRIPELWVDGQVWIRQSS